MEARLNDPVVLVCENPQILVHELILSRLDRVESENWTIPISEYEYQDVDRERNGEWQLPKGTMRERIAKDLPRLLGAQFICIQGKIVRPSLQIIAGSDSSAFLGHSNACSYSSCLELISYAPY